MARLCYTHRLATRRRLRFAPIDVETLNVVVAGVPAHRLMMALNTVNASPFRGRRPGTVKISGVRWDRIDPESTPEIIVQLECRVGARWDDLPILDGLRRLTHVGGPIYREVDFDQLFGDVVVPR